MNKPEPMTDEQIIRAVPGLLDCLQDPYDQDKSGDNYSSIPHDMVRLGRAIIAARDAQWEQMLAGQEPVAWLIEFQIDQKAQPEWFVGGPINSAEFHKDANRAMRFSRKQDAQAMLDWLRINEMLIVSGTNVAHFYKVTEHMWCIRSRNQKGRGVITLRNQLSKAALAAMKEHK